MHTKDNWVLNGHSVFSSNDSMSKVESMRESVMATDESLMVITIVAITKVTVSLIAIVTVVTIAVVMASSQSMLDTMDTMDAVMRA